MEKVTVVRERRKSLRLQVLADGQIEVRAPRECAEDEIEGFLQKHQRWICSRQQVLQQRAAVWAGQLSTFRVLGEELPVRYSEEKTVRMDRAAHEIVLPWNVSGKEREELLGRCLAKLGRLYLPARTEMWAKRFGLRVEKVTVTSARKRWGSCTVQKHTLHFSRWLMAASPKAVDSVIIHELMHLIVPNHSAPFHALTEKNTPDYKECKRELRELAEYLLL